MFLKKFVQLFSKRLVFLLLAIVMWSIYSVVTDPDTNFIQHIPLGFNVVISLNVLFWAILLIAVIEYLPDILNDENTVDRIEVRTIAKTTPEGAGLILLANALRLLAYAVVVAVVFMVLSPMG